MRGNKRQRGTRAEGPAQGASPAAAEPESVLETGLKAIPITEDDVHALPQPLEPATAAAAAAEGLAKDDFYRNKQRVLILASRGITARYRHLMDDLRRLIPHHKKDSKLDAKDDLRAINEIAAQKSCSTVLYLEMKKHRDLYMWLSRAGGGGVGGVGGGADDEAAGSRSRRVTSSSVAGPSVKFLVSNVHTMDELRLTGNCMLGSRPLLSFDRAFDSAPHLQVIKALLVDVFGTPRGHPKSKPFVDRVMNFSVADGRIWIRNYQIAELAAHGMMAGSVAAAAAVPSTREALEVGLERGEKVADDAKSSLNLVEIGPRLVLTPIRIAEGSFTGESLYLSSSYVSPSQTRANEKLDKRDRHLARMAADDRRLQRFVENQMPENEVADVFRDGSGREAKAISREAVARAREEAAAAAETDSGQLTTEQQDLRRKVRHRERRRNRHRDPFEHSDSGEGSGGDGDL